MSRVSPGDPAPDFSLEADDDSQIRLSDLAGTRIVLYLYPKDDTTGCTTKACDFRDLEQDFSDAGARIIGVGRDSIASRVKFRDEHGLPFALLSDPDHSLAGVVGAWVTKKINGRGYMGVERSTFVISADGAIERALHRGRPRGHAGPVPELLAASE